MPDGERRGDGGAVLSPRPAPRQTDAVVVMAQEALAAAALGWQERSERLSEANARLKNRVAKVEEAHRKSLTVVKNVPALPNNHVFTKQLVDENHALRQETRALQRRLMQFEGPGAKKYRNKPSNVALAARRKSTRVAKAELTAAPRQALTEERIDQQKVNTLDNQAPVETPPTSSNLIELARHPLVQDLKTHFRDLEVDLDRLRQENELLRAELDQYQGVKKPVEIKTLSQEEDSNAEEGHEQIRAGVDALIQQMKVLEARYQHLEEKARAKTALNQEITSRLEEVTTQLFEVQQQAAAQAEKLQVYSDQTAQMDNLQQEIHLLRSENMKLNEVIAALSSRPFDALSKDVQKKNLWIAQLEEEARVLESDRSRFQTDCIATRRANVQLRHRVEAITTEVKGLADELNRAKAECEQKAMEKEVAQLQLRFYTAPGDHGLMSAVGKAIKEMKKQQQAERHAAEDQGTRTSNGSQKIDSVIHKTLK
ncbi:hypothetical protein PHYPSEUDO_005461 [Phytophthora pseudosyringae]|uniref:Uncharacterized protein n=1 Tax=Phytophthora pseudosyringae TaxID=221518 RepID=A0A8T1VR92_9STRA|nr:hypothetical protein PHYPSEUDO_005461 [Phytophthora pseudosyringae]